MCNFEADYFNKTNKGKTMKFENSQESLKGIYVKPELTNYGKVSELTQLFGPSTGDIPAGVTVAVGVPGVASVSVTAPGPGSSLNPF